MKGLSLLLCAAAALAAPLCPAQDALAPAEENPAATKVTDADREAVLNNLRQQLACLRELRDAICTVQDKAGADAAATKVKEIAERYVQLAEASQKFGEVTDESMLQEVMKLLQDEPAAESLPLIVEMLGNNDFYGSTALKEALVPFLS
ncbi:MAG: hypothetical protein Q4C88_07550 [Akkermansia sp.]|nr:hypothetical protein [Akkermansia sp.]